MRLVEIRISNFRGISGNPEHNKISFSNGDIIFLVGQNNTGKSTYLKAYDFFHSPKRKASQKDFFNYDPNNSIVIEADFRLEGNQDDIFNEPDWINNWVQAGTNLITIKKVWTSVEGVGQKYTKNPSGSWVLNGFGGLDTLLTRYAPTPVFVNAVQTEAELEKAVNSLIEKQFLDTLESTHGTQFLHAKQAISTLQSLVDDNIYIQNLNARINVRFQSVFPRLTLQVSSKGEDEIDIIKAFKANHSINIKKSGIDRVETFDQHGHGVIRQAFFNFLAYFKNIESSQEKKYLLLFEEPELYLHPKSERLLREQLYDLADNSPFQIVCATHSSQMIDLSKQHSSIVRVVKDNSTEHTRTFQAGRDLFESIELRDYVKMLQSFDPHVCESFYSSKVIIVEGFTEALCCREILKTHYPDQDIFVFNAGTKNNIPFYLKILNHFHISYAVIHDSDTRFNYESRRDCIVKRNRDGGLNVNSAWTFNNQIWDQIMQGRENGLITNRYVSVYDFEHCNDYVYEKELGKPMSAYNFIKRQNATTQQIFQFVSRIVTGTQNENDFSSDSLEALVAEPYVE
jgi:putative ATP-dependent endonuclease of OLD family